MANAGLTAAAWKIGSGGTYAACGLVRGGNHGVTGGTELLRGAGGELGVYHGDVKVEPTISGDVTNVTLGLLVNAMRATYPKGDLEDTLYIKVGNDKWGFECINCVLNRLSLKWEYPGRVTFDASFIGLSATKFTSMSPIAVPATDSFFDAASMTSTIATAAHNIIGWEATWNNNWSASGDGDTARGTAAKHFSTLFEAGIEEPGLRVTLREPLAFDVTADAPTTVATSIALDNGSTSTYKGFTIVGTGLRVKSAGSDLRADEAGAVPNQVEFLCAPGSLIYANVASA